MKAAVLAAALAVSFAAFAEDPIAKEIARLEQTLKATETAEVPKDVRDLFAVHRTALERAAKATSPAYRLYRLRDPFVGIETLAFLAKHPVDSVEKVDALWRARRSRFEAKPGKPRGSLLQRALIESAATRAERLFHASLPYAKASQPWSGVFYLGEAEGNLRFRDFVQSLAGKSDEKAPARERVAAIIDAVERDTLSFFAADVTNQAMVPVSVRIKEARELLAANRLDGATLLIVEARAALSRRGGPKGTYPQAKPQRDSVAALLEAWAADEQPPMSDALRGEVATLHAALYASAPAQARAKPRVTVTLVRWPYT